MLVDFFAPSRANLFASARASSGVSGISSLAGAVGRAGLSSSVVSAGGVSDGDGDGVSDGLGDGVIVV